MKTLSALIVVSFVFVMLAAVAPAAVEKDKEETKLQESCPLMGGKINKSIYADHDGKRVYFCCGGCVADFKADPAKYIAKLEAQGITLATVQTHCPIMTRNKINKKIFLDHDGQRVYFCCNSCLGKFQADPAKGIEKLEAAGIALEPTPKQEEDEAAHDDGHNH